MARLVAIVDDEPDIVELVSVQFQKAGFEVQGFGDAEAFLEFLEDRIPDIVLLDLMLPDVDGLEICKTLRSEDRWASIPIIMLTARTAETDKVLGLELGADDYVTKPFSPRELVARVKAVLRRGSGQAETNEVRVGRLLAIDSDRYEVRVQGRRVELTPTEFRILRFLASNRGRVFSRDQILDHLWGHEKAVVDRTVDVHIRNIREKLGRAAKLIKNVRGIGYKVDR
jgi:two-component system phosphate regulon response regulator PhoB/two-component system alkaline phosphatase synthesis response regulator PhoP